MRDNLYSSATKAELKIYRQIAKQAKVDYDFIAQSKNLPNFEFIFLMAWIGNKIKSRI